MTYQEHKVTVGHMMLASFLGAWCLCFEFHRKMPSKMSIALFAGSRGKSISEIIVNGWEIMIQGYNIFKVK